MIFKGRGRSLQEEVWGLNVVENECCVRGAAPLCVIHSSHCWPRPLFYGKHVISCPFFFFSSYSVQVTQLSRGCVSEWAPCLLFTRNSSKVLHLNQVSFCCCSLFSGGVCLVFSRNHEYGISYWDVLVMGSKELDDLLDLIFLTFLMIFLHKWSLKGDGVCKGFIS